ncbi:MAG: hypothetical protein ACAH17_01525 [Candidatus Paceibacterota bacterium]
MTQPKNEPRELVLKTIQTPEPHIIYEMAKCHPDFFTTAQEWHLIEKSAYDKQAEELAALKAEHLRLKMDNGHSLSDEVASSLQAEKVGLIQLIDGQDEIVRLLKAKCEIYEAALKSSEEDSASSREHEDRLQKHIDSLEDEGCKDKANLQRAIYWFEMLQAGFAGMFGNNEVTYEADALESAPKMVEEALNELRQALEDSNVYNNVDSSVYNEESK